MIEETKNTGNAKTQSLYEAREKLRPTSDLIDYARRYTREKPALVALVCVGIGFVLGWKLKPW